jgi:TetR/AcrR family transcriptional regulator, transcriptional repressor for nem operon
MSRHERKEQTRQRMVDAAARSFRKGGYGVGVDALARQAGMTSGAFYVHFASKADAFQAAVRHGMADLEGGVRHFQQMHGAAWWPQFVRFYLGPKRCADLTESCSLQSLAPELARAESEARAVFGEGMNAVANAILSGPRSSGMPRSVDEAYAALATLAGAVTFARAVDNPTLALQIVNAAGATLLGSRWTPLGLEDR